MEKQILYSKPINNEDKKDNETYIYRHPFSVDKNLDSFVDIQTLHQVYVKALSRPKQPLLGRRMVDSNGNLTDKFTWFSTEKVFNTAKYIGSGLINLDLLGVNEEWNNYSLKFVGIYSKNSVRYATLDIACGIYGFTSIPIYDTLGEEATEFAFQQTKMKTCFVTCNHVEQIVKCKKDQNMFQSLENLVIFDKENMKSEWVDQFKDTLKIWTFEQIYESGQENPQAWAKVKPDDVYCFSYTSGTTGTPKGAMITHRNVCSAISCTKFVCNFNDKDVFISYLPMAHVLERMFFNTLMYYHVKIGVYSGDTRKLMEDLAILKPTIFLAVPRILNKIYDAMRKKIDNSFLSSIINSAVNSKIDALHKSAETHHWFHDKVFFKQARAKLGGRVRIMMTGSAPISQKTLDFLKIAFSSQILEGYGQTEACAFEFGTKNEDGHSGHVGGPVVINEFKLVDCPDLGYTNKDKDEQGNPLPRGELWVRGPNVIPGYFKLDEKNKETFTEDGWLQSGDIAQIEQPGNRLKIIDRKKNIFKLSQGEYIAAEKLENAYEDAHNNIKEIFIYGDSHKSCIVAIVNIEQQNLQKFAQEYGIKDEDLQKNEEFKKKIIEEFNKVAKAKKFNSLEKVKGVIIDTQDWQEIGLVTTSFKKKRHELKKYFKDDIDKLYEKLY